MYTCIAVRAHPSAADPPTLPTAHTPVQHKCHLMRLRRAARRLGLGNAGQADAGGRQLSGRGGRVERADQNRCGGSSRDGQLAHC